MVKRAGNIEHVFVDRSGEYTVVVHGVKITFLSYPFPLTFSVPWAGVIAVADLLTLAAMKAYTLGRRAKWKDYVDLYVIMKHHHTISEVVKKAREMFGEEFNEKLFRSQLAYFADIDYSEKVIFMKGWQLDGAVIQRELLEMSVG